MRHPDTGALLLLAALYFFLPLPELIALLLAAAAHELGHIIALLLTGQRITGFTADVRGATISRRGDASAAVEVLCAAAGPLAGVLYALAAGFAGERLNSPLLAASSGISAALSVFNLLPALPLDGGRIALAALGERGAWYLGLCVAVLTLAAGLWLIAEGLGCSLFIAGAWLTLDKGLSVPAGL